MPQAIKTTIWALIGALPGLLLAWFIGRHAEGFLPAFLVAILLGALVGGLLSLPNVSGGNVLAGLFGMIVAKNVPGGSAYLDHVLTKGDHDGPTSEPHLSTSRFALADPPASFEDFARQHVNSIADDPAPTADGSVDPAQAVVVEEAAPFSLAASAEVAAGDHLLQVEGFAACDIDWDALHDPTRDYTYRFHRPSSGRIWNALVSGAPLGARTGATIESLAAQVDQAGADFDVLEALWERGEWPLMQRAADQVASQVDPDYQHVADIWRAAALYENGEKNASQKIHADYLENHSHKFVMSFRAVAAYYVGLTAIDRGDRDRGVELLQDAYECWEHDRFADAIERHTGARPTPEGDLWKGRRLSLDYELRALDGSTAARLGEQLQQMPAHQVTALCLLGDYRANGPYAKFMRSYRRWATFFPHFFAPLHVITMNDDRSGELAEVLEPERTAQGVGVPMHVLLDADGAAHDFVQPPHSPFLLYVDHDCQVIAEGLIDEIELWRLLQSLAHRVGPG